MLKRMGQGLRKALARTRRRIHSSDGLMWLLLMLRNLLLYVLVLGFLVFEEVWEVLHDLLAWRKYYPRLMVAINGFATRQNRYMVLLIYLSLFIPMELLGLFSAALVAEGFWKTALLVYVSKGFIAIPAIDIFVANKGKLLSFWAIARGYGLLLRFKHSDVYLSAVGLVKQVKRRVLLVIQRLV